MAIAGRKLQEFITDEERKTSYNPAYIPDLDIEMISPNPYQPRIEIRPESLLNLADSIRSTGVLEPLLVTKKGDNKYELIAGERRWRAAKIAKVPTVPVIIKEASPLQMLELAIIENIHRKDLNPLEEGLAFEQLMNLFNMDHADIAKKIGCSRSVVTNKIRLLTLPDPIKKALLEDKISEGHARAILGLSDRDVMLATVNIIIRDRLSVRQVEELVRRLNEGQTKKYNTKAKIENDVFSRTLEQNLQTHFHSTVKLARGLRGGKIIIPFKDDEDLKRIAARIL
jgi:ParB family transcriptional regulator, chromosome partitioning protein